jgi:quercetin dioxygenase-like cupin family protein
MPITVEHHCFEKEEEAIRALEASNLHVMVQDLPASEGTPLHWHDVDIHVYITSGTFRFQDPSTGDVHECVPGTRFHIPPGTLHIEEAHKGYSAVLGFSVPFEQISENFVRPPEELEA